MPFREQNEAAKTEANESDDDGNPDDELVDTENRVSGATQAPPQSEPSSTTTSRRSPMVIHVAVKKGAKFHLSRGCAGLNNAERTRAYTPCRICGGAYQVEALQRERPSLDG